MSGTSRSGSAITERVALTGILLALIYALSGTFQVDARLNGTNTARPAASRAGEASSPVIVYSFDGAGGYRKETLAVEAPPAVAFVAGEVDLSGDGVPERVTVNGARLQISAGNRPVWQSDPAWTVVDAALGDPNNDGRFEALVAFEKPDPAGRKLSQPFIVGYRRGLYGTWWGGSPVAFPLQEVELADTDADLEQELIAIERLAPDLQRVGVWRWHGWGFSLLWSSEPGRYSGLRVLDVSGDGCPEIVVSVAP